MKIESAAIDVGDGWLKSSFSNGGENACLLVRPTETGVETRNSNIPDCPITQYTTAEFSAFVLAAKAGEFDHLI